jgi:hypothetical protein
MEAAFIQSYAAKTNHVDFTDYLTTSHEHCIKGAENCHFKAEYAYAVNVYDMSLKDITQMFVNHALIVFDLWMFLPTSLVDHHYTCENDLYRVQHCKDGKSYFHLNDNSDMYIHNTENWRSFVKTVAIKCRDFGINIEHKQQLGTFTHIRFTRTTCIDGEKMRCFMIKDKVDVCAVPDMQIYFATGCTKDYFRQAYLVPVKYVQRLMGWSAGVTDTQWNYNTFATFASSISSDVKFTSGNKTIMVHEGFEPIFDEFETIKQSLFIIASISRFKRTKFIKIAYEKIKSSYCDTIFGEFFERLKQIINEFIYDLPIFRHDIDGQEKLLPEQYKHIFDVYIKYPKDQLFDDVVTYNYFDNFTWRKRRIIKDFKGYLNRDFVTVKNIPDIYTIYDQKFNIDKQCGNIIYNPFGDGKCGLYCLMQFKKEKIDACIGEKYTVDGKVFTIEETWHSDFDLAYIANKNKISLAIHQVGALIGLIGKPPYNAINVHNMHWTVVKCDCFNTIEEDSYIGLYEDLKIDDAHLYINQTDAMLTEKSGSSKAFANRFKNYSKKIKTPVDGTHFLKHQNVHLAVVCPRFKQANEYDLVQATLHNIIGKIAAYSDQHEIKVYLPIIGNGLFRNDLCCFKTVLKNYNFLYTLCFPTQKSYNDYHKTLECKHGGFDLILPEGKFNVKKGFVDDSVEYGALSPQYSKEHLRGKFDDIVDYCEEMNFFNEKVQNVYDLSFAPGYFAKQFAENDYDLFTDDCEYHSYYYKGKGDTKPMEGMKYELAYKDLYQLAQVVDIAPNSLIIYDNYLGMESVANVLKFLSDGCVLITKLNARCDKFSDVNNTICNAGCVYSSFLNEFTPPKSFEMFLAIRHNHDADYEPIVKEQVDLSNELLKLKIRKENAVEFCECDVESIHRPNAIVKFNLTEHAMTETIKSVIDGILLFDKDFDVKLLDNNDYKKFEEPLSINCTDGVAGSRKTTGYVRGTCKNCCTIIAPFRAVIDGVNAMNNLGVTYIKYIYDIVTSKRRGTNTIIIDEMFACSGAYIQLVKNILPNSKIFGVGDSKQIDYRDYANTNENYEIERTSEYIVESYRTPQVVSEMLTNYIPGYKSNNPIRGKYEHIEDLDKILLGDDDNKELILCFTQEVKEELLKKAPQKIKVINTVNAVQGITAPYVRVYLGDLNALRTDKVRYIYTAVSRCTTKLVTYGSGNLQQQFFEILGTEMERILEAFDQPAVTLAVMEKDAPKEIKHSHVVTPQTQTAHLSGVEDIIKRIYVPTNDNRSNIIGYKHNVIPPINSKGRLLASSAYFKMINDDVSGKRISTANFCQYQANKNKKQKVETVINRYMKEGKSIPKDVLYKYIEGFSKFMKKGWQENIRKEVLKDDLFKYTADYLMKLQTKYSDCKDFKAFLSQPVSDDTGAGNLVWLDAILLAQEYTDAFTKDNFLHNFYVSEGLIPFIKDFKKNTLDLIKYIHQSEVNKIKDLQKAWQDSYHSLVQFHLKTQCKEIREPGFDVKYKAGQGVSAWSKLLNVLFSTFTRCFSDKVNKYVLDCVQLSYGKSDTLLQEFFKQQAFVLNSPNFTKMMADFTEFDSSQEEKGIMSSVIILKSLGFKTKMMDFYMNMRSKWTLYSNTESGGDRYLLKVAGEFMQHSGQPFTLDGNTMFNMSAIGMCYVFDDLAFAAFKGDDSAIAAGRIRKSTTNEKAYIDLCGYKIKAISANIIEYIANIITPDGNFFPDVLRRINRAICKIHKNDVDWEETRIAVTDSLDVMEDDEQFYHGCKIAEKFYAQFNISVTADEIAYLCYYLYTLKEKENLEDIKSKKFFFMDFSDTEKTSY